MIIASAKWDESKYESLDFDWEGRKLQKHSILECPKWTNFFLRTFLNLRRISSKIVQSSTKAERGTFPFWVNDGRCAPLIQILIHYWRKIFLASLFQKSRKKLNLGMTCENHISSIRRRGSSFTFSKREPTQLNSHQTQCTGQSSN